MNIFIYGNYGYGNLADDVILETFLEDVDKKIKKKNFVVSCVNPKNVVLSKSLLKRLKLIDAMEGIIPFKNINEINNSDAFVLGGAPHLGTGPPAINELSMIFAALFLGKEVFIWGIEFGPMGSKFMKFLGRKILSKVSLITVRAESSYKRLIELGVKCPFIRSIDPVLHWKPKRADYKALIKKYKINLKKPIISFFPRIRANWPRYYNFTNKAAILKEKLEAEPEKSKERAELIDFMIEKTNGQVLLIAEEFFDNKSISDINKLKQIVSYSKYKDKVITINEVLRPAEFKYLLQQSTMVISERLHPIIMTRDAYIPAISFWWIYEKIEEVMKDMGQGKRILSLKGSTKKDKKILMDTFNNRTKIKKELMKDYPRLLKLSNRNNQIIEEIAKINPEKPKRNLFKKFLLYILFVFIGFLIYIANIIEFIKVKFIEKKKLLYLKDLP